MFGVDDLAALGAAAAFGLAGSAVSSYLKKHIGRGSPSHQYEVKLDDGRVVTFELEPGDTTDAVRRKVGEAVDTAIGAKPAAPAEHV